MLYLLYICTSCEFSSPLFKKCHLKNMLAERIKRILNQTSDRISEYSRDVAYRKCNEERKLIS